MKMNKKVLVISMVLMVLFGSFSFAYSGDDGGLVVGLLGYDVTSPRNLYDDYKFEMTLSNNPDDVDIEFRVYNIETGVLEKTIDRTLFANNSTFSEAVFGTLNYRYTNTYRYELYTVVNNVQLFEGFVAKTPSVNWYENADNAESEFYDGATIGDSVYNDIYLFDLLFDPQKPNQTVFTTDDYFTLHYKFSSTDMGGFYNFYHENTSETYNLSYDDIVRYQTQSEYNTDTKRSFMVIPVNGNADSIYSYDVSQYFTTGDNIMDVGFNKGVYTYKQVNPDSTTSVYGQTDLVISDDNIEWDFYSDNNSIKTGSFVYTNFINNTSEVYDIYSNILLSDLYLGNIYSSQYSSYNDFVTFNYRLIDMNTGEIQGEQNLYIDSDVAIARNGFAFENYSRKIVNFYEIRFVEDVGTALTTFLESFGLGGTAGGIFFTAIIILISVVMLGMYNVGTSVIGLVAITLLTAFAFIGLIPIWFVLLLGIFGALTLFNSLGGE